MHQRVAVAEGIAGNGQSLRQPPDAMETPDVAQLPAQPIHSSRQGDSAGVVGGLRQFYERPGERVVFINVRAKGHGLMHVEKREGVNGGASKPEFSTIEIVSSHPQGHGPIEGLDRLARCRGHELSRWN